METSANFPQKYVCQQARNFPQNSICQPNTTSLANSEPIDVLHYALFFADNSLNSLAGEFESVDPRATLPHDCSNPITEAANDSICILDHIIERGCEIITENIRKKHIQPCDTQSEVNTVCFDPNLIIVTRE